MPLATVGGVNINFDVYGSGQPVVLLTGSGGKGQEWVAFQVPALNAAGYRVITVDNRGVPPSDMGPAGFTIGDMAGDVAGLIEYLGLAPCRLVGFSLGGVIVLELLVARPELASQAVVMGARGRTDVLRAALSRAWSEAADSEIPAKYLALVRAMQYLSPCTLNDEQRSRDWLDILEMVPADPAIDRAQRGLDLVDNRLKDYRKIQSKCLVVSFRDDLVVPAFFGREIADCIPGAEYEEVDGCGHYGHLEQPDEVNKLIVSFFNRPPGR